MTDNGLHGFHFPFVHIECGKSTVMVQRHELCNVSDLQKRLDHPGGLKDIKHARLYLKLLILITKSVLYTSSYTPSIQARMFLGS